MSWRFYLRAVPSGEWIDKDVPLSGAQVVEAISGPASISGSIPYEYSALRLSGGRLAVREWGCLLIAEQEGRDPVVCVVDTVTTEGQSMTVSAGGFSMYPVGLPWRGADYSSTGVDPLDVVRMVWDHVQGYPDGDLGVVFDQTSSPVRLGTPDSSRYADAKRLLLSQLQTQANVQADISAAEALVASRAASTFAAVGMGAGGLLILSKSKPSGARRSSKNLWFKGDSDAVVDVYRWNGSDWVVVSSGATLAVTRLFAWQDAQADLKVARTLLTSVKQRTAHLSSKKDEAETDGAAVPYTLTWFETDDLGKVISDLAESTPFEYREVSKWVGDELALRLQIGYPKIGARRDNLRFEVGVNITVNPAVDEGEYASELILRGAGEGRKKVGALVTQDLGRLRRVVTVVDETLSSKEKAEKAATPMLKNYRGEPVIESLTVIDHPSAPIGSFDVGDEIRVQGDTGWRDLDMWVRVLEVSVEVDSGSMSLKVEAV